MKLILLGYLLLIIVLAAFSFIQYLVPLGQLSYYMAYLIVNFTNFLYAIVFIWPPISIITIFTGTILATFLKKGQTPLKQKEYIKTTLLAYSIFPIIFLLEESFGQQLGGRSLNRMDMLSGNFEINISNMIFGGATMTVMGIIAYCSAKRFKTIGLSQFWALLCAIPLAGHIITIWLGFKKDPKHHSITPDLFS